MTRTGRWRRTTRPFAFASGLLAVFVAVATVPAAAAETSVSAEAGTAPVMIVLDASGSMNQDDAPGPRIDAAKTAVRDLVRQLPAEARVGLTVYGTNTGSSDAEKAAGCRDITQLAPVGPVDEAALTSAVDGIRASGYTPIGAALQQASAALPGDGPRSIVLVSDGEDTCSPPPPCEVAQQLKQQGVDLVVHTVGFKVDAAARAQLTCIAQATGGTYSDATDAGSLGAGLDQQVSRALRPYDVTGQRVAGTGAPTGAPVLTPGQYVDSLPNAGDDYQGTGPGRYYAVDLAPGETPYLSATVVPGPTRTGDSTVNPVVMTATLTAADGGDCSIFGNASSTSGQGKYATTTLVMVPGAVGGPDWPPSCPTDGRFLFFVNRGFGGDADLPVEIAVRIEPPVGDTDGLPAAATASAPPPVPTPRADVAPQAAGTSYNSATVLTSGRTVSDDAVLGEDRYFKVHLDWGQQLAFRLDTGRADGLTDPGSARVQVVSPVRQSLADAATQSTYLSGGFGTRDGRMTGGTGFPVRWTNRTSSDTFAQPYAVDGDYYVVLATGYPASGSTATGSVPYTLTVDVTGRREEGPTYLQAGGATGGNDADGNGSTTTASTTPPPARASDWSTSRTALVGGSVLVAVAAAGLLGVMLLARRRGVRVAGASSDSGGSNDSAG